VGKIIVNLGRTGDLLALLPLLWKDAQSGERPQLMVGKDYAPLLDGVSYVEPIVADVPHTELGKACEAAATMGEYQSAQVNGPVEMIERYTMAASPGARATSFQKEMWRVLGRLNEWDNLYPLVIDRRDAAREAALVEKHLPKSKRRVLLVAASGHSSPFPYRDLLFELLHNRFGKVFTILSLDDIQAERIYDLLALYEKAHLLIAIDSAPLHLAWAMPQLPVMALTADHPSLWHGSSWKPNHVWYCRYRDFPARAVEAMTFIETFKPAPASPRVVLVWNGYENTAPVMDGEFATCPIHPGACGRDSGMRLQDPKRVPYLKDCLRMGLQRAGEGDFVALTRPETHFITGVSEHMRAAEASYAYRIMRGIDGGGGAMWWPKEDLFCASKAWWRARLDQIPDFLFGADDYWSNTLRAIFVRDGAAEITGTVWRAAPNPMAKK
jgi:hypothetical protein